MALVEGLVFEPGDVVVEYGPGTGPVTEILAGRRAEGFEYLGIERDPGFCAGLRQRFPALRFVQGTVEDVERHLAEHGLGKAKAVISGLPFASLPADVAGRVIEATHAVLRPDGEFRTFQYVHAYCLPAAVAFRRSMRERFSSFERSRPVLLNVPPAYVLRYKP